MPRRVSGPRLRPRRQVAVKRCAVPSQSLQTLRGDCVSTWQPKAIAARRGQGSRSAAQRLRIREREHLVREIAAWQQQRPAAGARVDWMFTTGRARTKLARAYPEPSKSHNHCAEALAVAGV